jgi:hypothetical protein
LAYLRIKENMTTVQDLKKQLNIESDYTDDDLILQQYLNVAEASVLSYLNLYTGSTTGVTGTYQPVEVKQGVLLLAAHLYTTRQIVAYGQPYKIPYTFEFLLNPYKEFTVY